MIKNKYSNAFFYVTLSAMGVMWAIFYCKYVDSDCFDIVFHNNAAKYILGNELNAPNSIPHVLAYPLYHIAVKLLVFLFGISYDESSVFVICICNIASVLICRKMLKVIIESDHDSYFIDFLSLGSVVFMPAYSWLTNHTVYAIHTGANPLHNPTIIFVRPFGLACIICFAQLLKNYDKKRVSFKWLLLFSVFSLLTVFSKPSFAMVFFPAMGIVCLYIIIKNRDILWGGIMLLGIAPSIISLLWQVSYMKENGTTIKMIWGGYTAGFGYGTWDIFKVTIGVVPVAFILINSANDLIYKFAWIAFIFGWLQMFTLSNGGTGDFAWGFMLSMQFLTIISLCVSAKSENFVWRVRQKIGFGVYLYQVLVGVMYFLNVFKYGRIWI